MSIDRLPPAGEQGPEGDDLWGDFIKRTGERADADVAATQTPVKPQPQDGWPRDQKEEWKPGQTQLPPPHSLVGRAPVAAATEMETGAVPKTETPERQRRFSRGMLAGSLALALALGGAVAAWKGLSGSGEDNRANGGTVATAPPAGGSTAGPTLSPTPNTSPSAEVVRYADYPVDYTPRPDLSAWGGLINREWGAGPNTAFSLDWNGTSFPIDRIVAPTPGNNPSYSRMWNAVIRDLAAYMSIDPAQAPEGYDQLVNMLTGGNPATKASLEQHRQAFAKLSPTEPAGRVLFMPWDDRDNNPVMVSIDDNSNATSGKLELDAGTLYVSRMGWSQTWIHDTYLGYSPSRALFLSGLSFTYRADANGTVVLDTLDFKMLDRVSQQEIK